MRGQWSGAVGAYQKVGATWEYVRGSYVTNGGTYLVREGGWTALEVGQDIQLLPSGRRARIRALQIHKRSRTRAVPGSRVAANLVGTKRDELERGHVLTSPDEWRSSSVVEAELRPVRGLAPARSR